MAILAEKIDDLKEKDEQGINPTSINTREETSRNEEPSKTEQKLVQNEMEEVKLHKQKTLSLKLAPQTISRILGIAQTYIS